MGCLSGPNLPFQGKVSAFYARPVITFRIAKSRETTRILSVKTSASDIKFKPTYDSSVPLNPWSKVSLNGYMVARVKKILTGLMDAGILKAIKKYENVY